MDFLEFAFCHYLVLQFLIRKILMLPEDISQIQSIQVKLASYFLTPATLLFTLPSLLVFMLFRKLVDVALNKYHGLDYFGLLDGYCTLPDLISVPGMPNAINELHCMESSKSFDVFFDEIIGHMLETVWSNECYSKLFSIRDSCLGYLYLKRHNLDAHSVISKVDSQSLNDFLQECNNAELPAKGRFNWDMKIGSVGTKGKYYIFIRLHHCIADGSVMYNLVSNILYKPNPEKDVVAQELRKNMEIEVAKMGSRKQINRLITNHEKANIFNVSKSYETNIVYQTYDLLPAIEDICKETNATMPQVVLTAFGAALSNYMEANSCDFLEIPKKISCGYPKLTNVDRTVTLFENKKSYIFSGRFAGILFNLPIDTNCTFKQRLDITIAALEKIITSYEIPFNANAMETFIENLPTTIGRLLFRNYNYSGKIFNIEGGPALQLFNGDKLLDKVIFFPKVSTSGFGLTFTNYNKKLQISLSVSQEQPNVKASQMILEETANNISSMHQIFTS